MSERAALSVGAQLAFGLAGMEAEQLGSAEIDVEHLVIGIWKVVDVAAPNAIEGLPVPEDARGQIAREHRAFAAALGAASFNAAEGRRALRVLLGAANPEQRPFSGRRTERCRRVFTAAATAGAVDITTLMYAALGTPSPLLDQLFERLKADRDRLRSALETPATVIQNPEPVAAERAVKEERGNPSGASKWGRDLTALARAGKLPVAFGRHDEIKRVARILLQAKKANPLLVGDPGVGKTAIVEGLALKLTEPTAPRALRNLCIVEVSLGALVAGAKYRGEFEERMQALVKEAETDPNLVLFIDEIHMLLGAGGSAGSMDAANLLKPALARGAIRVIGATTTDEYRKYLEKDGALSRRFQAVWIDEPSRDAAVQMLEALRPSLQEHHGVRIDPDAVTRAVDLSIRYLADLRLPDKAIDLMDQACARALLSTFSLRPAGSPSPSKVVDGDVIATVVAERCRVPIEQVAVDEAARLLHMEAFLERRVIGQPRAVMAVADAIRTARAGLRDPRRPSGVFLFAGPTGTGKTELAKALAEFLFGDEQRLIRIDLSEYGEKHSVARLIGSPPGYVGHDEGGQLTDAIRTHPYSVVLLDEIDKAHPEVLDVLLPVLDEGHLTDGQGRQARFSEAVVIMTSNYGMAPEEPRARAIGFGARREAREAEGEPSVEAAEGSAAHDEARVREAIAQALRPELLNRIPNIVVFDRIGTAAGRRILEKVLGQVRGRIAERRVTLDLAPSAYELLLRHGVNEQFGAREMERAVDRLLVQPLGRALLAGRFLAGATVTVTAMDDRLLFESSDSPTV